MRRIRNALLALALCLPAAAVADLNTVFVSQDVPAIMVVGQSYPVNVTVQNSGSWGWNHLSGYALGSQNPQDNTTWGLNRVPLTYTVALNEVVPFDFQVTAPATAGTYNFQWRMVSNNLGWFGATSPNVAVQVVAPDAQFISQFVPTVMNPGQTYSVSVTMKNIGSAAWAPGSYRLGSQNPADNTTWGLNQVELSSSVAPGANATFSFDIVAPATPGPYNFQWRMVLGTSHWFGASSSNVQVDVGTSAANMHFVHVDHLNTPRLVANGSGTAVWRWDQQEPFGNNVADEDPDGNAVALEMPLRFPGQYADKETNLHYNYFRDCYDPVLGRYCQSDPIGLAGGHNTYSYVEGQPLGFVDPLGLFITSVQAACAVDPMFCSQVLGQIVQNTSILTQGCVTDSANQAVNAINAVGSLASLASTIAGVRSVASVASVAAGPSSLITYIASAGRKFNQLTQRGWTQNSINQLVNNPYAVRPAMNRATGNPATAYLQPNGHYVIRDDVTGDLVQLSNTNRSVGMGPGQWRPDSSIVDPLIPGSR